MVGVYVCFSREKRVVHFPLTRIDKQIDFVSLPQWLQEPDSDSDFTSLVKGWPQTRVQPPRGPNQRRTEIRGASVQEEQTLTNLGDRQWFSPAVFLSAPVDQALFSECRYLKKRKKSSGKYYSLSLNLRMCGENPPEYFGSPLVHMV